MTQIILFETLIVGTIESIYPLISFTDEILKPSDMKLPPSSTEVTATLADVGMEPTQITDLYSLNSFSWQWL